MDSQEEILRRELYQFRLYFSSRDTRQARRAAWIHALDLFSQVELVDLAAPPRPPTGTGVAGQAPHAALPGDHGSEPRPADWIKDRSRMHLESRDGELFTGYYLFEWLVWSLRPLWPIAFLTLVPGVAGQAKRRYPGTRERRPEGPRSFPIRHADKEAAITAIKKHHE